MAERHASPASTASAPSSTAAHADKEPASRTSTASPPTSTPPTSLGDEASILSEMSKMEVMDVRENDSTPQPPVGTPSASRSEPEAPASEPRRGLRNARKVVTYNVQILAGTAIHTPTKYLEKHHESVVHGDIQEVVKTNFSPPKKRVMRRRTTSQFSEVEDPAEQQLATEAAQAAQRRTSSRVSDLRRVALDNLSGVGEAFASTISAGKNALKRSASDSRLRSSLHSAASGPSKRARIAHEIDSDQDKEKAKTEPESVKPKTKQWLRQGLYVGQHREFDPCFSEATNRVRRRALPRQRENKVLPLPIFGTEKMLSLNPLTFSHDFKLPFDVYNPLPRKVKVDGWVKLHKNRFIGDASALWKREKHGDSSQCFCEPEDGCGETCHNRIMAYECDATNCPLTPEQCNNRPFAQLKKRSKGNRYDYGVEVMETEGKGYGVRAMRTFEPHQIIVEYAGEIITQDECERRMKQIYKKDKCYYLMSFDNKMIIDATRGTIARFVNHSCEPNCEMIKWTVGGEPRMALFAGSRGIMTGEELTYDYNFDPFSLKNIQECRCGTKSCRGVLGPKPKKPANEEKSLGSAILAGAKRKLQDVFGGRRGSESAPNSPKKRNMGTMATTKARNVLAQTEAAREQAQKDAATHAAQIASRENRALQRQRALATSKRGRKLYKASSAAKPTVLKRKTTTIINLQKMTTSKTAPQPAGKVVAKPGALKPVKNMRGVIQRKARTQLKKPTKLAAKAVSRNHDSTPEPSSEDESPNITPASLRSANKKTAQSKAAVKPLKLRKAGKLGQRTFQVHDSESESESSGDSEHDSDEENSDGEVALTVAKSNFKGKKRGSAPAPRGLHKTGAGVAKGPRGRVLKATGRHQKKGAK